MISEKMNCVHSLASAVVKALTDTDTAGTKKDDVIKNLDTKSEIFPNFP